MGRKHTTALFTVAAAVALAVSGCSTDSSGDPVSGSAVGRGGSSAATPGTSAPVTAATSTPATTGGTQDAAAAIRASLAAAKQAKLFHLVGEGTDSGEPLVFDIHFGSNGSDGSVTMNGAAIQLKVVGNFVYFNAPASFYRTQGGDAVAARLAGKWVKAPKSSETGKGFTELADSQALIASFTESFTDKDAESIKPLGSGEVEGVATKRYGDDEGVIDITASGAPYPLKLVSKGPGDAGTLEFSEWNKPYRVTLPPASQIVSLPS